MSRGRVFRRCVMAVVCGVSVIALPAEPVGAIPVIAPGSAYRQANLVSDLPGVAFVEDPLLVNPWGIALSATSPFWVANNGTSTSNLYREISGQPLVPNPGIPTITIPGGLPTGTVFNSTASDFQVSGMKSFFIFASITGNIVGWNPNVPAAGSTTGVIAASHPGHVYTGLAIGTSTTGEQLYAADFANGTIDTFDETFTLEPAASFPFADPTIPTTPGNTFHPYNVQKIGSSLYVTYAKVGVDGRDEEGVGNGFVRRFNMNGVRDLTFGINNGPLNSPWGITIAPATFGIFGGALLVGNFGRGNPSIHAFNPTTGAFLGTIQNEAGDGIEIDELWALSFGNGGNGGDVDTLYFTSGMGEEEHGLLGSLKPTTASATNLVQFSADDFTINEGALHAQITITRSGDLSGASSVDYATWDQSAPDHANQKSDYEIATGQVNFAPGQSSRSFQILIVDDQFDENDEVVDLQLSNPTGAGTGLGSPNAAQLSILDNDTGAPTSNPIDDAAFFVRQQYIDFLNREPDAAGQAFWTNQITSCGANASCISARRVNVSAAFFLSIEFQKTGFLVHQTHFAAGGGERPLYGEFMRDTRAIGHDVVIGQPGAEAQLEENKQAFFNDFVTRPEFVVRYPNTLTNAQYVDALIANTGVTFTPAERNALVSGLDGATMTRATVLRSIAEDPEFGAAQTRSAFVLMEYFGYLRRNADTAGFNFWLAKLNAANGDFSKSDMVKSFLVSSEYRQRFGP